MLQPDLVQAIETKQDFGTMPLKRKDSPHTLYIKAELFKVGVRKKIGRWHARPGVVEHELFR